MNQIELQSAVSVKGFDLFGRKAEISFRPTHLSGWQWQMDKGYSIEISPEIINLKSRRTQLFFDEDNKLEVYEHIGLLRWFGLCNVLIESTSWPPYHGRLLELWQAIKPHCQIDKSKEISWYTVKEKAKWVYPESRNGLVAFTEILPNYRKELNINLISSYPGLETTNINLVFPDKELLERLSYNFSQGWPPILYHLLKIPSFFGWPHHDKIVWIQREGKESASMKFAYHRMHDLLGLLSLLCRDGLLSANVISVCSGHRADVETVLKADRLLYKLD
jgi:hypothetical protein